VKLFPESWHRNRYMHATAWDLISATAATCMYFNLIPINNPDWRKIPSRMWLIVVVFFVLSAAWSHRQHRKVVGQRDGNLPG
jgi:hypothetical protein